MEDIWFDHCLPELRVAVGLGAVGKGRVGPVIKMSLWVMEAKFSTYTSCSTEISNPGAYRYSAPASVNTTNARVLYLDV